MKRIPVQLFHKDPETGSVPLKDLDRSAPAVAKIKHTAGVWVEVEFQFDDCSQSIVTFPNYILWLRLKILEKMKILVKDISLENMVEFLC